MTTAEAQTVLAEIAALRERIDSLEATVETFTDPDLLAQLAESRASIERGDRTYSLDEILAERAQRQARSA